MTDRNKLAEAIRKVAWGYVLLHLNITIGAINILPNWLGHLLFLRALPALAEEEPSARLLRPIITALGIWEAVLWLSPLTISLQLPVFELIASVLLLYMHFQLLTNLSQIAGKYNCPQESKILRLRTVQTILTTLFHLPISWLENSAFALPILIIWLFVAIWICTVLFSMRRSLLEPLESYS